MRAAAGACTILQTLKAAGFEAYLVGGCVRDMLLAATEPGVVIHDWDICTSARPDEIKAAFHDRKTLDTGIKHGTITVLLPDGPYEVTTFRIDGSYSDSRHPDTVTFASRITEDLSRRDFTFNAMAMSIDGSGNPAGIVDPFGGQADLSRRRLRCVGDPATRFEEDALRILRAIRFAARLSLEIEPATQDAMLGKRQLLRRISVERSMDELGKILLADRGWEYLLTYRDILAELLPEMRPCIGFAQHNPWHRYDVFEHSLTGVGRAPADLTLRLALLLHDIGKPASASTDEAGIDHFYGHPERSAEMAAEILKRMHCPRQLSRDVVELVRFHDIEVRPSARVLRRLLNRLGEQQAKRLLQVKRADLAAQSDYARERKEAELEQSRALLEQILSEQQAFTVKDLKISGRDLIEAGFAPGPEIGARLRRALEAVLDGTVENEKTALLAIAEESPA